MNQLQEEEERQPSEEVNQPPSEFLSRNEALHGYIFVCRNATMQASIDRGIFGVGLRHQDCVARITPGMPLFLYNYDTKLLHGVYEASSHGRLNIDPTFYPDPLDPHRSRFPSQVSFVLRIYQPPIVSLVFRRLVVSIDDIRFRRGLNLTQVHRVLDVFELLEESCDAIAGALDILVNMLN